MNWEGSWCSELAWDKARLAKQDTATDYVMTEALSFTLSERSLERSDVPVKSLCMSSQKLSHVFDGFQGKGIWGYWRLFWNRDRGSGWLKASLFPNRASPTTLCPAPPGSDAPSSTGEEGWPYFKISPKSSPVGGPESLAHLKPFPGTKPELSGTLGMTCEAVVRKPWFLTIRASDRSVWHINCYLNFVEHQRIIIC